MAGINIMHTIIDQNPHMRYLIWYNPATDSLFFTPAIYYALYNPVTRAKYITKRFYGVEPILLGEL